MLQNDHFSGLKIFEKMVICSSKVWGLFCVYRMQSDYFCGIKKTCNKVETHFSCTFGDSLFNKKCSSFPRRATFSCSKNNQFFPSWARRCGGSARSSTRFDLFPGAACQEISISGVRSSTIVSSSSKNIVTCQYS